MDFIKRLEQVMEHYHLPAAALADKIGVQRSGISHLLSGRNKPSLDFVIKLTGTFPDLDLYWLLHGKGGMLKNSIREVCPPAPSERVPENISAQTTASSSFEPDVNLNAMVSTSNKSAISTIVVLYADGTFESYSPGRK